MQLISTLPPLFISLCFLEGVMSLVSFLLFGLDKIRAKGGGWRVPEKTLLLISFFLGGVGGALGMTLFRHKTKHIKFQILVPLFCILQMILLAATFFA